MWFLRQDLLGQYMRSRRSSPATSYRCATGKPRSRNIPSLTIVLIGLAVGAVAGLVVVDDAAASRAGQMAHNLSPNTWLAERQARLNPRIPAGGFKSCDQAKAAGFGRIWRGAPAYSSRLDADGDGKACEWNAGWFD